MKERFRVLQENGYGEVERQVKILEENGYEIVRIEKGEVPFCEGPNGQPVMVPGWSIVTERPTPRSENAYGEASVNPNLQDPPAPWLWK